MSDIIDFLTSYANGQETDNSLETYLTTQIQKTLQDNHYRIQQGSRKEFWILFKHTFLNLSEKECLINLIKFARNVVAGDLNNQQFAIQYGALECIQNKLQLVVNDHTSDNNLLLQVCTQAVCNMITNTDSLDTIWQDWMLDEKGRIWSNLLSSNNNDLITSVLILIINCTRGSKSRCNVMVENANGRKILGAILDDLERLHDNESRNFELGYTIFNELFACGYFKLLYGLFKNNLLILNTRQTILLKILDSKIHAKDNVPSFVNTTDSFFLCQQFEIIAKETVNVIVSVKGSVEKSDLEVEQVSNIYTAVILLLQILNQLLLLEADGLKQCLVDINAIFLVIDILGHLQTIQLPPAQTENPELGFNFLKRECVRMMGSLCYHDKTIQDNIRELSGIPLILDQFKIDDSNPYLREYATLALRNLMEDNVENQNVIRQLEPQQVLQTDELTRMGITPELLKNGQVRINKTEL